MVYQYHRHVVPWQIGPRNSATAAETHCLDYSVNELQLLTHNGIFGIESNVLDGVPVSQVLVIWMRYSIKIPNQGR